jgi:hypothetical protein
MRAVFLHVPWPSIRRIQSLLFTFRTCQRDVECLEAVCKKCESKLAFKKYMHLPQKANSMKEARELAWGAEGGEELIQKVCRWYRSPQHARLVQLARVGNTWPVAWRAL